MNNRLKAWAENYDILTDAQFGFKTGYSTVDAVFILHSLIEEQFINKGKLFACFVDFKKANDSIDRNALWLKILKSGIDGKFFTVLRSMYSKVKTCVKHMNSLTDFFDSNIGLFQGEITSILFSLFLNDIENYLQLNLLEGIRLGEVLVYLLMFADDAVLLSETAEGLQKMLLKLESYCSKWNLTVNTVKTKIMIFQKGGQLKQTYYWTYNNEEIEVVKTFVYYLVAGDHFNRQPVP